LRTDLAGRYSFQPQLFYESDAGVQLEPAQPFDVTTFKTLPCVHKATAHDRSCALIITT
jgi:hypothetical protein